MLASSIQQSDPVIDICFIKECYFLLNYCFEFHVIILVRFFCDCGFHSVCPLMDEDKRFAQDSWWEGLSSVAQLCLTPYDLMDCSTPGFPVHHQLLDLAQTHVHQVGDAIQSSQPLSSPSPPAFNLSQHQGLFKGVSSSHQVAKVLEFQLQHQFFQWTPRADFL